DTQSFVPTTTGGSTGSWILKGLESAGIPGVSGAAGYALASKGLPVGTSMAGTAMAGLSEGALSAGGSLLGPAVFGLFDKGGLWGASYTAEDIAKAKQNEASLPNRDTPYSLSRLGNELDLPDWLYSHVFKSNKAKTDSAVTSGNAWVKGAARNTLSTFNWLGKTATQGLTGTNPLGWLKGAGNNISSFFSLGNASHQNLGKSAGNWLKGAAGNTLSSFNWLGNTASTGSIGGWKNLVGGFTNTEKGAGSWLKGAAGNTGSWLSGLLPGAASATNGIKGKANSISSDIFGKNGLLDFSRFNIKMPDIGSWFSGLKLPSFSGLSSGIMGTFNGIKSGAVGIWNSMSSTIRGIASKITSPIVSTFNGLKSRLSGIWNSIKSTAFSVWNGIKSRAASIWNGIKNAVWTPVNSARVKVVSIWNTLKNNTSSVFNKIRSIAQTIWNQVGSKIWGIVQKIWTIVSPILTNIKNAFNTMKDGLVSAATAIYNGVWGPINNLKSQLASFWSWLTGGSSSGPSGSAGTTEAAGPNLSVLNSQATSRYGVNAAGFAGKIMNAAFNPIQRVTGIHPLAAGPATHKESTLPDEMKEGVAKQGCNCYAGTWDFSSSWINTILDDVYDWNVPSLGVNLSSLKDLTTEGASSESLAAFTALANKIIGGTSYQFYYGDQKSNAQALADGRFNCYDGAQILVALAQ
ncbi:MAG: hypothetical protein K8E24_015965, partial [Methanobacterium paludis]|nr:hypothetical protein [Methanobacterium paludis]